MARFLAAAASASGESAAGAEAVADEAALAGAGVAAVEAGPSSALRFCKSTNMSV